MSDPPSRKTRPQFVRDAVIAHQDEIRRRLDRGQNMAEILMALALPPAITLDSFRRAFTRLEQRLVARAATRSVIPVPSSEIDRPAASPSTDPTPQKEPNNDPRKPRKDFVRFDKLDPEKVARWRRPGPGTKARKD